MTAITAFPDRHTILETDPQVANLLTYTASEAIYAGQVVEVDPTTGDQYVTPGDSDDAAPVVGVALYGVASSGDPVTVAGPGCVCYVANEDDTTAINEGTYLTLSDNNVGGCVKATVTGATQYIVGVALEEIAADGWGRALIMPHEQVIA